MNFHMVDNDAVLEIEHQNAMRQPAQGKPLSQDKQFLAQVVYQQVLEETNSPELADQAYNEYCRKNNVWPDTKTENEKWENFMKRFKK